MPHRQRVQAALAHQQPDAVPVDFGSTAVTGLHCSCVAGLREHYGLEKRLVKVHEPYQMLGWVEEDLLEALGVDVIGVPARKTLFGFPNTNWKQWQAPWGQTLLVSEHFHTSVDGSGELFIYPQGDTTVAPSGHMPKTGFFFDTIIRQEPIDDEHLNVEDNLEEFGPISQEELTYLRDQVSLAAATGRAVVMGLPGTALGDIAMIPAPFSKHPKGIRDVAEWYISTATRQDYLHQIFSRQVEYALGNLAKIHAAVGNGVSAVFLCGTDFGTQGGTFCSQQTFRELYLPYYRRMTDWIHRHTTWKVLKHSCGSVVTFMDAFVEAGFDILNPVQLSAAGMDARALKRTFGRDLVFWGGGVDTQRTLPFGSPGEVYREVRERIEIFNDGGGFVFGAIHNVQAPTPAANLQALFKAVRDSG